MLRTCFWGHRFDRFLKIRGWILALFLMGSRVYCWGGNSRSATISDITSSLPSDQMFAFWFVLWSSWGILGTCLDPAGFKWIPKCTEAAKGKCSQSRLLGSEFQLQIGDHVQVGVSCEMITPIFSCSRRCCKKRRMIFFIRS